MVGWLVCFAEEFSGILFLKDKLKNLGKRQWDTPMLFSACFLGILQHLPRILESLEVFWGPSCSLCLPY